MKKNDSLYIPDEPPNPYSDSGEKAYNEHREKTSDALEELDKMSKK